MKRLKVASSVALIAGLMGFQAHADTNSIYTNLSHELMLNGGFESGNDFTTFYSATMDFETVAPISGDRSLKVSAQNYDWIRYEHTSTPQYLETVSLNASMQLLSGSGNIEFTISYEDGTWEDSTRVYESVTQQGVVTPVSIVLQADPTRKVDDVYVIFRSHCDDCTSEFLLDDVQIDVTERNSILITDNDFEWGNDFTRLNDSVQMTYETDTPISGSKSLKVSADNYDWVRYIHTNTPDHLSSVTLNASVKLLSGTGRVAFRVFYDNGTWVEKTIDDQYLFDIDVVTPITIQLDTDESRNIHRIETYFQSHCNDCTTELVIDDVSIEATPAN